MKNASKKELTEFGQTALALDTQFSEFERLSAELEKLDIDSDSGFTRATKIQARREESDRLTARFQVLSDTVRKISTALSQLQKSNLSSLNDSERAEILQTLPEFEANLSVLVAEAEKLRTEAKAANLKSIVANADSMAQSLDTARKRLGGLIETRPTLQ